MRRSRWVKRCPNPMPGEESEIEIRPLFEAEDFGSEIDRVESARRPDARTDFATGMMRKAGRCGRLSLTLSATDPVAASEKEVPCDAHVSSDVVPLCVVDGGSRHGLGERRAARPMDKDAMMELWKQLATPGEPHKMLASLAAVGRPRPGVDGAGQARDGIGGNGRDQDLDGRPIYLSEYRGTMMGQPYSGIGIDGYDNMKKKYVTARMDSMGTGLFIMEGTAGADGRTITLKGSHPEPGGGQMHHRAVWKIADSNTQTFEMYGTHHGQKGIKSARDHLYEKTVSVLRYPHGNEMFAQAGILIRQGGSHATCDRIAHDGAHADHAERV